VLNAWAAIAGLLAIPVAKQHELGAMLHLGVRQPGVMVSESFPAHGASMFHARTSWATLSVGMVGMSQDPFRE
jgi:hypothetical protein